MLKVHNHLGQPIGFPLPKWKPPVEPPREPIEGTCCRLEPLDPEKHATDLHAANSLDPEGAMWTYLAYGPFGSLAAYRDWLIDNARTRDPLFFTIVEGATGKAVGLASYLRIAAESGSIEIGHLNFSPLLQRTTAATEANFLMMKRVFELGYRRCEWKCDTLNAPSRAAAQRLGFSFEGIFRQATVCKGRNRDTAWYSVIDAEWMALEKAFSQWLDPSNFDSTGHQRVRLADLTASLPARRG